MKRDTKLKVKLSIVGAAVALVVLSGCATAEKPNYQGHKGISPTVHDYYPSKGQ